LVTAAIAYQAEWTLALVPAKAVPSLMDYILPAAALDANLVIAQMGNSEVKQ
jgi:hypothetical protein